MLVQTVTTNSAIGHGGRWSDPASQPPANIATACHFATVYWLFLDEFSRAHSLNEVLKIGDAQTAVGKLIAYGTRKTRPAQGALTLTAGSVLIFVEKNIARHSCVAIGPQTVGGYNQMGWYSAGGADHGYSTHATSELMWASATQVRRVQAQGTYDLYEVPEGSAKAALRGLVQK
jgi:hypothetical protein